MGRRRQPDPAESSTEYVQREADGTVTVFLDGHPQSHLSPEDPRLIAFDYMQHVVAAVDALAPTATAFTHVGGAGLTLPRYFHATRDRTTHIVFEPDVALTNAVRAAVPLPHGHRVRVRSCTGQEGLPQLAPARCDVMIVDAFHRGRVPAALTTVDFYRHAAAALAPEGLLVHNLADEPDLRYVERVLASLTAAGLPPQARVSTHDVLKGRRYGNHVVVAARAGVNLDDLDRALRRCSFPSGYRPCPTVHAAPFTQENQVESPTPPQLGAWRAV